MKNLDPAEVFNIADHANKRRLMREALAALEANPDLGFVGISPPRESVGSRPAARIRNGICRESV